MLRILFFWVFCWILLAVGLRAYEPGLSLDGLVYAATAFQIHDSGDWIRLSSGTPVYSDFFEHPHLFFWVLASFLKLGPAEDWVLRMPTQLLFFAAVWFYVFCLRKCERRTEAVLAPVLLVLIPGLTQWFNNTFIDGFFFSLVSISVLFLMRSQHWVSGLFLGLAACAKGSTVLAVGPFFALFYFWNLFTISDQRLKALGSLARCFAGFLIPMAAYLFVVGILFDDFSFFEKHFHRHFTNRFVPQWDFWGFANPKLWTEAVKASSGLLLLFPFAMWRAQWKWRCLGIVWLLSWALMYGGGTRIGGWYTIPFSMAAFVGGVFLVSAWKGMQRWIPSEPRFVHSVVPLLLLGILQALPIPVRARGPDAEFALIRPALKKHDCSELVSVRPCVDQGFDCFAWAWYLRTRVVDTTDSRLPGCYIEKLGRDDPLSPQVLHARYRFWTVRN